MDQTSTLSNEQRDLMQRAERLYEERLKIELEKTHLNDFLVIEPDSGDYFLSKDLSNATAQARAAHPDRLYHIMRVGHRAAFHIGVMPSDW